MATPSTYPGANKVPAGRRSVGTRINQFWQRTTDGLELNQLWNQFRIDTRTSYRLEKLSPARRVLLLLAPLLLVSPPCCHGQRRRASTASTSISSSGAVC